MRISYGAIEFEGLRLNDWYRANVFTADKVAVLRTRHVIQFSCLLNEQVQVIPQLKRPASPADKDKFLRDYLGQPRRLLVVWMDSGAGEFGEPVKPGPGPLTDTGPSQPLLVSPLPGFDCDALNGPVCNVLSIDHSVGNRTIHLELEFETHTTPIGDTSALQSGDVKKAKELSAISALLSNRWTWTMDANDDYFAIHRIDGEAHFRLDILRRLGISADLFRQIIFHPVPIGFRRSPPKVQFSTDDSSAVYSIEDVQMPMNFVGGIPWGATRCEVRLSQEAGTPNDISNNIAGKLGRNSGALTGAAIGTATAGLPGTIIGGLIGSLFD